MQVHETAFNLDETVKISYDRIKEDILKISPTSGHSNWTTGTKSFEINNQQYYLFFNKAYLEYEVEITPAGEEAAAANNEDGAKKVTLENNWFPRCFQSMMLRLGTKDIENINTSVGEASTILNLVTMSDEYKRNYGMITGWIPDTKNGSTDDPGYSMRRKVYKIRKADGTRDINKAFTFTGMFPLFPLFGFCDVNKPLYLIKIALDVSLRNATEINNEIFLGVGGATATLKFNRIDLCVPYVRPSLQIEEIITKRLRVNKPIEMVFLKRNVQTTTILTGSTFVWNLGNYRSSIRFLLVAFKPTAAPSNTTNNSVFKYKKDAHQIKKLQLQLNNEYYPLNGMSFDFNNLNMLQPYNAYIETCNTFGVLPQLNLLEYRDLYPVFCIDCSAQSEMLKTNGLHVSLHIEKDNDAEFKGHCVLLEDNVISVDVGNGEMSSVN